MAKAAAAGLIMLLMALPAGAEVSTQLQNHLETSRDIEREIDILENWTDLDLYSGPFQIGLRWSAFWPPDPGVSDPDRTSHESITHRFAELGWGDHRLRVGTFTQLFGRGLALRSYENRDLRVDSNLDGVLYEYQGAAWTGRFLRGRIEDNAMEHYARKRADRVSGMDLERDLGALSLGGSAVFVDQPGREETPGVATWRGSWAGSAFSLDYEGGHTVGGPREEDGRGHVVETSLLAGPMSFYGGYKYYENFSLQAGGKAINQAPALLHDQRATLLNRHPHTLDMESERGLLLDLSLSTGLGSFLGSYAFTEAADGSRGEADFRKAFLEWDRWLELGPLESAHVVLDYQTAGGEDRLGEWTLDEYITLVGDVRLGMGYWALVLEWEHQHKVTDRLGEYDDEFFTAELTLPNGWVMAVLGEFLNWSEEQYYGEHPELDPALDELKDSWYGLQLAGPLGDRHELRLFGGSRRAGYICAGGFCRYEPAFDGVELALLTRF